jgi:hypothetical protein
MPDGCSYVRRYPSILIFYEHPSRTEAPKGAPRLAVKGRGCIFQTRGGPFFCPVVTFAKLCTCGWFLGHSNRAHFFPHTTS